MLTAPLEVDIRRWIIICDEEGKSEVGGNVESAPLEVLVSNGEGVVVLLVYSALKWGDNVFEKVAFVPAVICLAYCRFGLLMM